MSPSDQSPEDPLVSVLMLAYNHGPYLAQAIESVLAQEASFAFELLIGEDCSSDDSADIARGYQARHPDRIRVITSASNVGMHENHARLVRAARGAYLAYCEGDDFWQRRDKLALQVAFLREHPDHVAVHSDFASLARYGTTWRAIPALRQHSGRTVPQGEVLEPLLSWCFIQTCTVLAESGPIRDFLASPLGALRLPSADWSMFLYLAQRGRIGYLDEPLATYRRTPGSAMNSGPQARLRMDVAALELIDTVCAHADVPEEVELAARQLAWAQLLVSALRADDVTTARRAAAWSAQHPPVLFRRARRWVHALALRSGLFRRAYLAASRRAEALRDRRAHVLPSPG